MKVLIAGDFCPRNRVANLLDKGNFNTVLGDYKNNLPIANYYIVNFECPVVEGKAEPILKLGPNLRCSEKGMEAVKWAGFTCVTLANNHFKDYGEDGIKSTLEMCRKYELDVVGGGANLYEAAQTFYKNIDGVTLAIINCCEHEFSIATDNSAGSNPLNPIQQFYAIKEAKEKSDYVLVIVHGGHEYYQLPSIRMQETYRFFIDAGADAVVNHHQHCYSGYEFYNGKPIVYGLGNFCFDEGEGKGSWNEGCLAIIDFLKEPILELIPYIQCDKAPMVKMVPPHGFKESMKKLNDTRASKELLKNEMNEYYKKVSKSTRNVLNPVVNRYLRDLQYFHLFPDIISDNWLNVVHNHVMCEAHRDKLIYFLNHRHEF